MFQITYPELSKPRQLEKHAEAYSSSALEGTWQNCYVFGWPSWTCSWSKAQDPVLQLTPRLQHSDAQYETHSGQRLALSRAAKRC